MKKYNRNHILSPHLKSRIRLLYASRYLNLVDPEIKGESVLIVGGGSSAEPREIKNISERFSTVITLNSALFSYPEADIYSFEFANKDDKMCAEMIKWINKEAFPKLMIKPHSIWPMSKKNRRALLSKQKRMFATSSSPEGEEIHKRRSNCFLRGIRQNHFPSYSDITVYKKLGSRDRGLYQWSGSVSLWLDAIHLNSNIKTVGLIGTDFGGPYATSATWHSSPESNSTHLLQVDRSKQGGPAPFLDILKVLRESDYLSDKSFHHFHYCDELKALL